MAPISEKQDVNATSRYADAKPTELVPEVEVKPEAVPGIVAEVRAAFDTEKTFSAEWRKAQLLQLKKMIIENEKELCQGMLEDLHKSPFEGYMTEIALVLSEIDTTLAHLDEWMAPVKGSNSALNIPSWSTTQRDPLGVCLLMGAWNYPVQLQLAPLVGCIAGGNCAILKPGSYATACSNVIARIVPKYMDPECIRVVEGNRHVTNALLAECFDLIFFTGSAFVGKIVARAAAEHLCPVVLELGGKSPCIVDKSANLEHAAKRVVWSKFLNSGQTCVASDFLCVHESVADQFVDMMRKIIVEFYGQDAQKTEWFGRLINDGAFSRLSKLIEAERDRIVHGGDMDEADKFISPTLIDFGTDFDAFKASGVMSDELFGPILPIYRFKELEQVVQFTKHLPTGKPLAFYAYGTDRQFINTIKNRTTSGGLVINDSIVHLLNHSLPFGGVGNSGMGGGYHGKHSFERFTHLKAVLEKSPLLDESIFLKPLLEARFPPYNTYKKTLVRELGKHWAESLVNIPIPLAKFLVKALIVYIFVTRIGARFLGN